MLQFLTLSIFAVGLAFNIFPFTLMKDDGAHSLHGWTVLKSLQFVVRILQTIIFAIADFPQDQVHKVL